MRRALARWRSHAHQIGEQWSTWRHQWRVERDLQRLVSGHQSIIAGPWCSEVGYEVLYWLPFLRWVMAAYRLPAERVVAVSRGGTSSWYSGIASRYIEVFDVIRPSDLAARVAAGILKQRESSEFDQQIVDEVLRKLGLPRSTPVLHPSLMFRWFAPFWSGQETLRFVERHTRFALMVAPKADVPVTLPREYVAVKFYAARSLPDQADVRAQLRMLVESLADRLPIVYLETGLGIDDHDDYVLGGGDHTVSLTGRLSAETNLAVQTQIIAGARLYVGTCGSLAWLAPLLGVPTVAVFTDAGFLHAHLHLARRVYGRLGAGPFSPVDLSGIMNAGLAIGTANGVVVNGRRS